MDTGHIPNRVSNDRDSKLELDYEETSRCLALLYLYIILVQNPAIITADMRVAMYMYMYFHLITRIHRRHNSPLKAPVPASPSETISIADIAIAT